LVAVEAAKLKKSASGIPKTAFLLIIKSKITIAFT